MAMHAPNCLVRVRHALAQHAQKLAVQLGHRVADRIGNVDRRRTLSDRGFEHAAQEIGLGAIAVFGRELDVIGELTREAHREFRLLVHLLRRHA